MKTSVSALDGRAAGLLHHIDVMAKFAALPVDRSADLRKIKATRARSVPSFGADISGRSEMRLSHVKLYLIVAALVGCTTTDKYPVSGNDCGPDDAVKTMDAGDCTIPTASVGSF